MTKITFNSRLLIRVGQHEQDFKSAMTKVLQYHSMSKSPETKGDATDILVEAKNILSFIPQAWYQKEYEKLRQTEQDGFRIELSFIDKLDRTVEIQITETTK